MIKTGIVCGGGLGTRLYPLTYATNKHLLPVYDKPMVYYPIQTLVNAGIKDVVIVTGGPHAGHYMQVLRDGKDLGLDHIYYSFQAQEGGISEAIACAEPYAGGKDVAVILGDNCTDADISKEVKEFKDGATIFLKRVDDPERFGVVKFAPERYPDDPELTVEEIVEKPSNPPSNFAVTGLYLYDKSVFDRIRNLKPSARGELEVTDLNNSYLKDGKLKWSTLEGYWRDCGTFETLLETSNYWRGLKGKER